MYSVSLDYLVKIMERTRTIKTKIDVNNGTTILSPSDIIEWNVEYSFSNEKMPGIGGAVISMLDVTLVRENLPLTFGNAPIKPYVGLEITPGNIEWVPLGVFYMDRGTVEKTDLTIKFKAYDVLRRLDLISDFTSLDYLHSVVTVRDVANELATVCGITYTDITQLPTWRVMTPLTGSARSQLAELAATAGANVCVARDGKIDFRTLVPSYYGVSTLSYIEFKPLAEEEMTISSITCQKSDPETAGGALTNVPLEFTAGTGNGAQLVFTNSMIDSQAKIEEVYAAAGYPLTYQPCYIKLQGMPMFDCGETYTFTDKNDINYILPVVYHKLTYKGGLISEFEAAPPASQVSVTTGSSGGVGSITQTIRQLETDIIVADLVTTNKLEAVDAKIVNLETTSLTAEDADIAYAKIDFANVANATIETALIQDAAITNAKIADASITSAKIVDATIVNADIANATIEGAKIANATIETANIADAAITTAKIGNLAVDTANIKDAAIETAKIADASITNAKIGALAVDTAEIADAAITNAKIGLAAVDTANIANAAITTALIETGAVGTVQIADGSITDAKIVGLTANKITAGTIDAADITVVNLNAANLTVGKINGTQIADGAITANLLGADVALDISTAQSTADGKNTVHYATAAPAGTTHAIDDLWFDTDDGNKPYRWNGTIWEAQPLSNAAIANLDAGKITTGSIAAARIAAGTIDTTHLAADAVTADKIAALAVDTEHLNANAVTSDKIVADAITTAKIAAGAVTANEIAANTITAGNIVAGTITSTEIAANAITAAKLEANIDLVSPIVRSGKANYTDDTNGYWLGLDGTAPKLYFGNANSFLKWTSATLHINGGYIEAGKILYGKTDPLTTVSGYYLGTDGFSVGTATNYLRYYNSALTLQGGTLTSSAINTPTLNVGTTGKIYGGKTTYGSATAGFFLGYSSGYKFDIGTSTKYLRWTGTDLEIVGGAIKTGTTGERIEISNSAHDIAFYDSSNALIASLAVDGAGGSNYLKLGSSSVISGSTRDFQLIGVNNAIGGQELSLSTSLITDFGDVSYSKIASTPNENSMLSMYTTTQFEAICGIKTTTDAVEIGGFTPQTNALPVKIYGVLNLENTTGAWKTWRTPNLATGWSNGGYVAGREARYYRDPYGVVHLFGQVKHTTNGSGTTIFTLPTGYRPAKDFVFPTMSSTTTTRYFAAVNVVASTGVVKMENIGGLATAWLLLDGISFPVW